MRLKHDLIILLVLAFTLVSARAQDNSGFDGKFVGIKFGGYDTFIPFASEKHQQTFGSPEKPKSTIWRTICKPFIQYPEKQDGIYR